MKAWQWWLVEAEEVQLPIEVAEEFTVWSVKDEAGLEGLLGELGWEAWERLQGLAFEWWKEEVA